MSDNRFEGAFAVEIDWWVFFGGMFAPSDSSGLKTFFSLFWS
jgi:hypothetical protein